MTCKIPIKTAKRAYYRAISLEHLCSANEAERCDIDGSFDRSYAEAALRELLAGERPTQRWITVFRRLYPQTWQRWGHDHPDLMTALYKEGFWLFPQTKRERHVQLHGEVHYREAKRASVRIFYQRLGPENARAYWTRVNERSRRRKLRAPKDIDRSLAAIHALTCTPTN